MRLVTLRYKLFGKINGLKHPALRKNNPFFRYQWHQLEQNRKHLINVLCTACRGMESEYLEVGCDEDWLFNQVLTKHKTGVDPIRGGNCRMTSDAFFAQNKKRFDVIFLDGLHHYQQLRKDIDNALQCLNDNGWIAMHDMLPHSRKQQQVPRISNIWTGDCWKVALELIQSTGLEFRIVYIDHGVGLLRKSGKGTIHIPDMSDTLQHAGFGTFVKAIKKLPLISFKDAAGFIRVRAAEAHEGG